MKKERFHSGKKNCSIIKYVSRIGSSAGISALQSMASNLKGTISIMMNKLVFLILKIKS